MRDSTGTSCELDDGQTAQVMKILGAWQAVATPPNIISAFKQTGLHSSWSQMHRVLVVSVDLAPARKLECERAGEEARPQRFRVNITT
jgi:hypothetical protein